MASIYKITSPSHPGKCYIGSTTTTLNNRLSQHYYDLKLKYKCTSSQLLDQNDAIIELLEICPIENRKVREQFHIDSNYCINKHRVCATPKQKFIPKKWIICHAICMICDKEHLRRHHNRHFKLMHTEK